MRNAKKFLLAAVALVLGLIGLLMSLCGGGFVITGLGGNPGDLGAGVLVIALPSLIVGLLLIWACVALFRRADRDND